MSTLLQLGIKLEAAGWFSLNEPPMRLRRAHYDTRGDYSPLATEQDRTYSSWDGRLMPNGGRELSTRVKADRQFAH